MRFPVCRLDGAQGEVHVGRRDQTLCRAGRSGMGSARQRPRQAGQCKARVTDLGLQTPEQAQFTKPHWRPVSVWVQQGLCVTQVSRCACSTPRALCYPPASCWRFLLFGSLNEVPGVTACCSALLNWLPRSSGKEAQLASDGIQFPVASENGGTSKSKSNGYTPALELHLTWHCQLWSGRHGCALPIRQATGSWW